MPSTQYERIWRLSSFIRGSCSEVHGLVCMSVHLCQCVMPQEGGYLLSQRSQAGRVGKGTCVQVLNLPKTGYLTWRRSNKSRSVRWAGRDYCSGEKPCKKQPHVLGTKTPTLYLKPTPPGGRLAMSTPLAIPPIWHPRLAGLTWPL